VVKAVDLAGKTITLKAGGKSFVFHVTERNENQRTQQLCQRGQDPARTGRRVYEPAPDAWVTGITYELKHASMFLLSVRPDGTVADVKPLRGLGYPELDARAMKCLKKWRFRPHSVTEVRMPFGYSETRHY